jgi:hypothetical protein
MGLRAEDPFIGFNSFIVGITGNLFPEDISFQNQWADECKPLCVIWRICGRKTADGVNLLRFDAIPNI